VQQTYRKDHLVQLVSLTRVLKFEIPLKKLSDFGSDLVTGLLHLGQLASVSLSPRNTTILKRWSQFPHLYSMVGMKGSPNYLLKDIYKSFPYEIQISYFHAVRSSKTYKPPCYMSEFKQDTRAGLWRGVGHGPQPIRPHLAYILTPNFLGG
jgi:hypothetical protein